MGCNMLYLSCYIIIQKNKPSCSSFLSRSLSSSDSPPPGARYISLIRDNIGSLTDAATTTRMVLALERSVHCTQHTDHRTHGIHCTAHKSQNTWHTDRVLLHYKQIQVFIIQIQNLINSTQIITRAKTYCWPNLATPTKQINMLTRARLITFIGKAGFNWSN